LLPFREQLFHSTAAEKGERTKIFDKISKNELFAQDFEKTQWLLAINGRIVHPGGKSTISGLQL
jgi:hypothetical protein